jgi:osmotically-inducible protein OsmY
MAAFGQDKAITQQVSQRIATRGIRSPCRVDVQSKNGEVTLTGNVQYAHERTAVMQAASSTSGVRHVVDRMIVKPPAKRT